MEKLKQRILKDGIVRNGEVLKVDSFLNHQMDIDLLNDIGAEFHRLFADCGITKILTIEASGIAIACMAANHFHVPVVFAKKAKSLNLDGQLYTSSVHSFTYDRDYDITVSKKYIQSSDKVLIIDDFMANGKAMDGLIDICKQAKAEIAGIGICIEKGFQGGGDRFRKEGYRLESLAIVESMSPDQIIFR